MFVRGRWLSIVKHAHEGMYAERPPIHEREIEETLDSPTFDDGRTAFRWTGERTIVVHYEEHPDEIVVRSVSATSRRLAA